MKKPKTLRLLVLLLFTMSAVFILLHLNLVFTRSFQVQYSDVSNAALDNEHNQIILDSAGQRLIKVNAAGNAEFTVTYGYHQGKGLNNAVDVITDYNNHIYLLNTIKEEGGYRIQKEEIVEYSPSGKYLGTVFQINHETPVLNKDIAGLYLYDNKLTYIIMKEDSFQLYDKSNQLINDYQCKGIKNLLISYDLQPGTHELYYSTKQGKIYKYKDGNEDVLLYDSGSHDYLSVPRDIGVDKEGNLYFTDIGLRTISKIAPNGDLSHVIYEGEVGIDTPSKYIYSYLNTSNGIIAVTSDHIVCLQDGESITSYGAAYTFENRFNIITLWIALVVISLVVLYILYQLVLLVIYKSSRIIKICIGVVCGSMAVAAIFILMVIPDFEARLMDSELKRAQTISDIIEIVVPTENFTALSKPADYLSENYTAVRDSVKEVFSTDNEDINDFYCVLYQVKDDIITGIFSLQEYSGAAYPYDWTYEGSDEQWIITNGTGKIYTSSTTSEGSYLFVLNPLFDDNHQAVGLIEVGTDLNSFHKATNSMIIDLLLNVFAITIVIILIALEVVIFMHGRIKYTKSLKNSREGLPVKVPNDLLRIMVFGIFFTTNITTSFLSLHALNIAESSITFGIPKEVLAAFPISAEVFFGALFSLLGSRLLDRLNQKKVTILGSILFTGGLAVRFITPSIWLLTLGNGIMGCGWGILLLLVNTAIANSEDDEKNKGFAGYTSGALNGVNCGIVFGGFLVNWFNHTAIFIMATVISIFIAIHAGLYLTKVSTASSKEQDNQAVSSIGLFKFLTNKNIITFFLMIMIPVIACSYFLNYLYPILGNQYGLSESRVGYSYLLNGLCVMLFSSVLTKYFSKKGKKAYSLALANLIYAVAFLCIVMFHNLIALIAVLILLGISDSFGLPLQSSYFTDLEVVKEYGYGKSIGIFSLFENISQAGGSFVFSYVLLIGVGNGLSIVLGFVAVLAVMFILVNLVQAINRRKSQVLSLKK